MEYIIALIVFAFGSIIGSFLNVVALRYNTGMTLGGRSACFSCGKKLSWHELFPILSYLFQLGRCRGCKSKISLQYPMVEALTGLLFVAVFFKELGVGFDMIQATYGAIVLAAFVVIVFSLLIVISVYDLRHTIIPNGMVYSFIALSFIGLFISTSPTLSFNVPSYAELASGPIYALIFASLWFFSRGKWIGLGDAKLALGIGWLLGLVGGGSALMFAFWLGALVGIVLIIGTKVGVLITGRKIDIHSEIPFAPFMILTAFFVYYTGFTMVDFLNHLQAFLTLVTWS